MVVIEETAYIISLQEASIICYRDRCISARLTKGMKTEEDGVTLIRVEPSASSR